MFVAISTFSFFVLVVSGSAGSAVSKLFPTSSVSRAARLFGALLIVSSVRPLELTLLRRNQKTHTHVRMPANSGTALVTCTHTHAHANTHVPLT